MEEIALEHAGDDLERFGPAGADKAEHAGDLPGEHGQRIVLHHRRHFEVLHRQHARAGGPHRRLAHAVERIGEIASDHRLDDARAVEFRRVVGDDLLPVAQNGDAVGQQQRLLERVRDEHDRDAAPLEVAHEIEEVLLLFRRQRRRRLVEDDHLGLVEHGARDFDHLLLGRAERADGRGRGDVEIQRLQELLRGDVDAAQSIVKALLAEEEVLRHRHRRHETVLLKHHGDAEMTRFERRLRRNLDAVDGHCSRGQRDDARHDFGQSRLARAVLADERMDLPAPEIEIDAVDRRDAGIEFGRFVQRENDVVAHAPSSLSSGAIGSFRTRPAPWRS